MSIKCFMIEPTDRARAWLRRFTYKQKSCPFTTWGHDAMAQIEDVAVVEMDNGCHKTTPEDWPHDDPRWPATCQCGYVFQEEDRWQLFAHRIYVRPDTGDKYTLYHGDPDTAPPGAMYYAPWMPEQWRGPDGRTLMVRVPGNHAWCVDGPATGGGKWERTGEPPNVTATPSIWANAPHGWHGWLTNGELHEV